MKLYIYVTITRKIACWKNGSVVQSTCCFCRGPKFASQHPDHGSQPFITPITRDPKLSSAFCWKLAHMWHIYIQANIYFKNQNRKRDHEFESKQGRRGWEELEEGKRKEGIMQLYLNLNDNN